MPHSCGVTYSAFSNAPCNYEVVDDSKRLKRNVPTWHHGATNVLDYCKVFRCKRVSRAWIEPAQTERHPIGKRCFNIIYIYILMEPWWGQRVGLGSQPKTLGRVISVFRVKYSLSDWGTVASHCPGELVIVQRPSTIRRYGFVSEHFERSEINAV